MNQHFYLSEVNCYSLLYIGGATTPLTKMKNRKLFSNNTELSKLYSNKYNTVISKCVEVEPC